MLAPRAPVFFRQRIMKHFRFAAAVLLCAAACGEPGEPATAVQAVVDSIHPIEEQVRRFKAARGNPTSTRLEDGAASRDELVHGLITAIENNDTAAIRRMMISPAEFIDLYYPSSPFTRRPYRQDPAFVWFQITQNSEKGIGRALQRFGGRPTRFAKYACDQEPTLEGANRLWDGCVVHWNPGQVAGTLRLFGTIIERNGRYKFVSYTNGL